MSDETTTTPTEPETTLVTPTKVVSVTEEAADEIRHAVTTTIQDRKEETKEKVTPKSYIAIIKANPLYVETSKVLHWRDPVKTGLLFGIFNFFFFLQNWADYSFVTIVSYLLLTLLCICFGYSNYVVLKAQWIQGQKVENPFRERFKDAKFHVTRDVAEKHLTTVLDLTNLTIDHFRDVFYCTDNLLSLRFALYFYLGATIGNWFSGPTLLYLATLGFFLWPRLYEEKQKEIDQFYKIAQTQANTYYNLALSKIPPAVTAKFPQLKSKSS